MITNLYIKDYILIDELSVDFQRGFSVFTGETGAGKSIVVDAIGLLTGAKASSDVIRLGAQQAVLEGTFDFGDNPTILAKIQEAGFTNEEVAVITREIKKDGKSTCRFNHRVVTVSFLRDLLNLSVDIHSQHDTQYLMQKATHIELLDRYLQEPELLKQVEKTYQVFHEAELELDKANNETFRLEDKDYLTHVVEEIEALHLEEGEMERLDEEEQTIRSLAKSMEAMHRVVQDYDENVEGQLQSLIRTLEETKSEPLEALAKQMNSHALELDDLMERVKDYAQSTDYSEEHINEVEQRLFQIGKLKHKYGNTYEAMEATKQEASQRLALMENREEVLAQLEQAKNKAYGVYEKQALVLSNKRKTAAKKLNQAIQKQLEGLMLPKARFITSITAGEPRANGLDRVEFLVAMNTGEEPKPLAKTASGGELSRLMLGLKAIFTSLQGIQTVVFDEIDSGVSGKVATAIGEVMRELATSTQVFAVTHLAPVAAFADTHYLVEKETTAKKTRTSIRALTGDTITEELALMASGSTNEVSLKAAKDLQKRAQTTPHV